MKASNADREERVEHTPRKIFTISDFLKANYMGLLRLTPEQRATIQPQLCAARDAYAKASGRTSQDVQDSCEEELLHERLAREALVSALRAAEVQLVNCLPIGQPTDALQKVRDALASVSPKEKAIK